MLFVILKGTIGITQKGTLMRTITAIGLIFLSALSWTAPSFAQDKEYLIDTSKSLIDFSFRSTLHPVKGTVREFSGSLSAQVGEGAVLNKGQIVVNVASMNTEEPKRDENMRKMLKAEEFSCITFDILRSAPAEADRIIIYGELTIRDVKLPLEIPAKVTTVNDGLRLSGETSLSLKRFSLKPPSVALLIRVFDTVKVNFSVSLTEKI